MAMNKDEKAPPGGDLRPRTEPGGVESGPAKSGAKRDAARTREQPAPGPGGPDPVIASNPENPHGIHAGRDMPGDLRPGEGEVTSGAGVVTPKERPLDTQPPTKSGAVKASAETGGSARPPVEDEKEKLRERDAKERRARD